MDPMNDHRCLYGHRVPVRYTYAIAQRQCPMCGGPTLTLPAYEAARRIASTLQVDAMVAFQALRLVEDRWRLVPVEAPAVAMVEVNEADLEALDEAPAEAAR